MENFRYSRGGDLGRRTSTKRPIGDDRLLITDHLALVLC